MRLTTRTWRRVAAATALAAAAVAAPAAALAAGGHPARPARPQAAAPRCRAVHTAVWLGLNQDGSTAGTTYYPLEFTNIGKHACSLYGYPGVSAVNSKDHRVGPPASHGGRRHTVTLRPGQTVHALLGIVQAGFISGCHAAHAAGLEVYPPNQTVRQSIGQFSFPACKSKVFMHVMAVQARVGIP